MDINEIVKKYNLFGYDEFANILFNEIPMVSVAIVSYKRPRKLIETLQNLVSLKIPLNVSLALQGVEELNDIVFKKVEDICGEFEQHKIHYIHGNYGSSTPRGFMISYCRDVFKTPYILTTDDDMLFPDNALEFVLAYLETHKNISGVGLVCKPNYPRYEITSDRRLLSHKIGANEVVVPTVAMGAATSIFRREIFEHCNTDPKYFVGLVDVDMCMQITQKHKYKLEILNIPELTPLNNFSYSDTEYVKVRYNQQIIIESKARFIAKWGLKLS